MICRIIIKVPSTKEEKKRFLQQKNGNRIVPLFVPQARLSALSIKDKRRHRKEAFFMPNDNPFFSSFRCGGISTAATKDKFAMYGSVNI